MCYLIGCYLAWPNEQGHWPALARAHYNPTLLCSLLFSPSPAQSFSPLPMNVSISLVMCKLFSPALRADGEQCLCRDFLCMSFLISKRVRRFPCSLLEKRRACVSMHKYITCTHVLSLTICNQYACCVVGILVQLWQ